MGERAGTAGRTVVRLLRESLLPLLLAGGYTTWSWWSDEDAISLADVVGRFSGSFFVVMWFVGQYLRVSKQLGWDAYFDEIRDGVNHLKTALPSKAEAPSTAPASAEVAPPSVSAPPVAALTAPSAAPAVLVAGGAQTAAFTTRALLTEAEGALLAGHPRAALMVAGAALEESVRGFAAARGIANADAVPLSAIIQASQGLLTKRDAMRLRRLWDVRNRAVHGLVDEPLAAATAAAILADVRDVSQTLGAAGDGITGIPCPRCKRPTMGSGGAVNTCGSCGFTTGSE